MNKISQKPTTGHSPPKITSSSVKEDSIHHFAFDYSLQANIISSVKTGEVLLANTACCELLGYSMSELIKKNRSDIFDINEKSFKKMIRERNATGASVAEGTAIKKSGESFKCLITSAVFVDEDGVRKSITTIIDQTEQILKQNHIDEIKAGIVANDILLAIAKQNKIEFNHKIEAEHNLAAAKARHKKIELHQAAVVAKGLARALKESAATMAKNNEWIKNISKTSYDVMWDWNIATGKMYVGDSIEEVFGYKVVNNTIRYKDCVELLLPAERDDIEKKIRKAINSNQTKWNDSFKIKRFDGSIATITTRASILRNENGDASHLIGSIQDISRLWEMEQKLKQQVLQAEKQIESFQLLSKLSFDGIWDFNVLTKEFFVSETFAQAFGISTDRNVLSIWRQIAHPDDCINAEENLSKALKSLDTKWEYTGRLVHPGGAIAQVFCRANIIRDKSGTALRIIGAIHDLSKENILEERLEQEIKLKELQIIDAMADARDAERSNIGQELHDNINQLLGASRLYLDLAKKGGDDTELFLSRSSEYTLNAIEEIRKLSKGLTTDTIRNLGLKDAIRNIARDTMETVAVHVSFSGRHFIETATDSKFQLNVYRIVQEQVNNIIKHAHATRISITLAQNSKFVTLAISDNGVGFDTFKSRTGIGFHNIISRATAYNGAFELDSHPGKGCTIKIKFPMTSVKAAT